MNLEAELRKAIRNKHYEIDPDTGLMYPKKMGLKIGGVFYHDVIRDGKSLGIEIDPNITVNQGLDHLLDVALSAATQLTTWYIGIFEGNYTPVAGDTATNIAANSTESTAYNESVRQTWTEGGVSSQSINNTGSEAAFTMNASKTIYGAFLISNNTKGGTSGTLMAASRFGSSRSVVATDVLNVGYTMTASDV